VVSVRRLSDWNTMERISSHFQSGEPLSKETFDQLNKAAVHMIGTDLCHELYLSALDLELYSTYVSFISCSSFV